MKAWWEKRRHASNKEKENLKMREKKTKKNEKV